MKKLKLTLILSIVLTSLNSCVEQDDVLVEPTQIESTYQENVDLEGTETDIIFNPGTQTTNSDGGGDDDESDND